MSRPVKIALVGRPNVGKSALFNRICQKRISIVDEAEGVTRDRLYAETEVFGRRVEMIDTGGIGSDSKIDFQEEIQRQAEIAIEEADHLIMVVDAKVGVTIWDERLAKWLLTNKKRVSLAVNKVDRGDVEAIHPFASLGIAQMTAVSATQGYQIAELLEQALDGLEKLEEEESHSNAMKIAIIGRPNSGKSTLLNVILNEERCIVSPIAGTTRDSVDVGIERKGQSYLFIDTAGIRRKAAEKEVVDKFAALRCEGAIERADICILMMDAQQGITIQEKRIASEITALGKGCIMLFNKWDLVQGYRLEHCLKGIRQQASFLNHCPAIFISAKSGRNVDHIWAHIQRVQREREKRITTGRLNKFLERAIQNCHPPMLQGRRLRIYYMAQVGVRPPHFVLFVNKTELMTDTYKKYLINRFREEYHFTGVPIEFTLRAKETV
jgi:GTPase